MPKVAIIAGFVVLMSIFTILGMTWGTTYNWPDFVHVDHGLPFVWGTHTLSTIIGPVDKWSVDLYVLTLDLAVWLGIMVAVITFVAKFVAK